MKRFRSLVRSLDADSVLNRESDETLRQLIAGVGRCVDGKVYIILKDGQNYLTQLVERLFDEGRGVIYYETLFERFQEELSERRFIALELLRNSLRAYFRDYAFYDECFEQSETSGSEPKKVLKEIERVWNGEDEVTLETLATWVLAPKSKIRSYLNASPKYAHRGEGRYVKKTAARVETATVATANEPPKTTDARLQNAKSFEAAEAGDASSDAMQRLLQHIVAERFANGFRLNSTIEASRLRKYAQETGCEEGAAVARLDDAALRNAVRKSGVVCDDKVCVVDKATDATIRAEVESAFDSGAKAIFYESLFERVAASAPDYFSLELLKDRVRSLYAVSDRKIGLRKNT